MAHRRSPRHRDLGPGPAPGLGRAPRAERVDDLAPSAFLRIPVEGALFVVLVLALPPRVARILAIVGGLGLGALTILRLLDLGFGSAFDRPFHPVYDTAYADSAFGLLRDSIGRTHALVVLVGAGLLIVALIVLLPLSAVRLTRLAAAHRPLSIRILALLTAVAMVTTLSGAQPGPAGPIASTASSRLAYTHFTQVFDDLRAQREFVRELEQDPFRSTPDDDLLTGLRGKDVLLVFVESYGRTALDLPVVESALDAGERRLQQAGFSSRSGFLTSPTFGGLSWLAHITLQSGLWVDDQQQYDHLSTLHRLTLTDAFGRAGWRTVAAVPANEKEWPMATTYYHYDQVWDARNVGYVGPRFGYAPMPDQYMLAALQRLELEQPNRAPVMAEIDLVSSHGPWAPLPRLVDWSDLGDGSIFDPMPAQGESPEDLLSDPDRVKAAYAESIAYTLDVVTSFVAQLEDQNLVLVVLGDHQPASIVSGQGASRDVPASIVAADPAVLDRVTDWGWQEGLRPDAGAPVWPMDAFRDKFLTTFGPPRPVLGTSLSASSRDPSGPTSTTSGEPGPAARIQATSATQGGSRVVERTSKRPPAARCHRSGVSSPPTVGRQQALVRQRHFLVHPPSRFGVAAPEEWQIDPNREGSKHNRGNAEHHDLSGRGMRILVDEHGRRHGGYRRRNECKPAEHGI